MAKGIGLIGNFKGKVGNMVGYQLSDSNTGNSQGIRVYQPNVKNPKTAAQAEQRAKLAPINATYRALKSIIDRGNEGLPYGNKSRLAWLKQAFGSTQMPWYVKGAQVTKPVGCQLTKGSLAGLGFGYDGNVWTISCPGLSSEATINTVGTLSAALLAAYPTLHAGDQITIVSVKSSNGTIVSSVSSYIINATSSEQLSGFSTADDAIELLSMTGIVALSVIVSRQGENGEHLRSTASLEIDYNALEKAPYDSDSKTAAIQSYMASDSVNSDWAEESIQ